MINYRNLFAIILFAGMAFSLTACSGNPQSKWTPDQRATAKEAAFISRAFKTYVQKNQGDLPQNIYVLSGYIARDINLSNYQITHNPSITNIKQISNPRTYQILTTKNPIDNKRIALFADAHLELIQ